ncbi:MAG: hypothetical protein P8Y67_11065 [Alphaproteobacteria bacterium]
MERRHIPLVRGQLTGGALHYKLYDAPKENAGGKGPLYEGSGAILE